MFFKIGVVVCVSLVGGVVEASPHHHQQEGSLIQQQHPSLRGLQMQVQGGSDGNSYGMFGPENDEQSNTATAAAAQTTTVGVDSDIIGGIASTTPYPYFGKVGLCGATLVGPDMMLTSARCHSDRLLGDNLDNVKVYIATTSPQGQDGVVRNVVEYFPHPLYDPTTLAYDYMLMRLDDTALYESDGITRTKADIIPLNDNDDNPAEGDQLKVMGFGVTDLTGTPAHEQANTNVLNELFVRALPRDCNSQSGGNLDPNLVICAAHPGNGGKGTCVGDDGGPLVDEEGVQVGLVSFGATCGAQGLPTIYSRISEVREWIHSGICHESHHSPTFCTSKRHTHNIATLDIKIQSDKHPSESSITFSDFETGWRMWFVDYNSPNYKAFTWKRTFPLPTGKYYFGLQDLASDGICCFYGEGYVEITNRDTGRIVFRHDGKFEEAMEGYILVDEHGKPLWLDENGKHNDMEILSFDPSVADPSWPGKYSVPNSTFAFTINIQYDDYPNETSWTLEKLTPDDDDFSIPATIQKSVEPDVVSKSANELLSFHQVLDPGLYHLQINDAAGDGNCCSWGNGYFTVTNDTAVLWEEKGNSFTTSTDAYIWVNGQGLVQKADHIEGLGYVLVLDSDHHPNPTSLEGYTTWGSATVELLLPEN